MQNLGEKNFKNAVVFPFGTLQGVCDGKGIYDENDECILGETQNYKANFKGKIEFIDEQVVFLGFFRTHYGHFITEELARLWWVIKKKEGDKK